MQWAIIFCSAMAASNVSTVVLSESAPFFMFFVAELLILAFGLIISCINFQWKNVSQESVSNPAQIKDSQISLVSEKISEIDDKEQGYSRYKRKINIITSVLIVLSYFTAALFSRPVHLKGSDMKTNPLFQFFSGFAQVMITNCQINEEIVADEQHLQWLKNCRTLDTYINQYFSPVQTCFPDPKYVDDFSFIKRTPDSPIKNVFVFFMETNRYDASPFGYNTSFARHLNERAKKEKNITPFWDKFAEKCVYNPGAYSTTSYTIKAHHAGLCSLYPFPNSLNTEYKYTPYHTCLPKLLKENGNFSSAFIEPMLIGFDHHKELIDKYGYDDYLVGENIQRGDFGPHPDEMPNGFGYEDNVLRKPMMNWVDKQVKANKPFFIAYSSCLTHYDFNMPKSWISKDYTNPEVDPMINQYFNAIKYMDKFYENMIHDFQERNLTKNTLFVFIGDHGFSFGEHGMWGAPIVPYETQFRIPIALFSENEKWLKYFPPKKINAPWITIDILPSVLDALKFDEKNINFTGEYLYEGQSFLRKYKPKLQFSFPNPGFSAMIIREDFRKIILPGYAWGDEEIYDLANDWNEENDLDPAYLTPSFKKWVNNMHLVRIIYIKKISTWYTYGNNYSISE